MCQQHKKRNLMKRTICKGTFAMVLVVLGFSATFGQEWEATDTDKLEILRVVIKNELERRSFEFPAPLRPQKLLLSSDGIESLPLETIQAELRISIIDPSKSRAYLVIKDMRTDGVLFTATLSRVTERDGGCFGPPPPSRCEKRTVYKMQRLGDEWSIIAVTEPRVNIELFACKDLNRSLLDY
jgi:hypothetical protein